MHCQKKICERKIEKKICIKIMKNKGKVTEETSYYTSNLKAPTKKSLVILRKHWKIESMALYINLFLYLSL